MPRLDYFTLCDSVSLDTVTVNRISFFHVIEGELIRREFPGVLDRLTAVSAWLPNPGEAEQEFEAALKIYPPGNDSSGSEYKKTFTLDPTRTRLIQTVYRLPLPEPGELKLEIWLNGVLIDTRQVHVLSG